MSMTLADTLGADDGLEAELALTRSSLISNRGSAFRPLGSASIVCSSWSATDVPHWVFVRPGDIVAECSPSRSGTGAAALCSSVAVFTVVRRLAELTASTLEWLAWIAGRPRTHAEVMDAWRSCPRLTVWEDALEDGLVRVIRDRSAAGQVSVTLTSRGRAALGSR